MPNSTAGVPTDSICRHIARCQVLAPVSKAKDVYSEESKVVKLVAEAGDSDALPPNTTKPITAHSSTYTPAKR